MAIDGTTLNKVKMAMRISTDAFDPEITDLIDAALLDLGIAGANGSNVVLTDALTLRAVVTYCRLSFGSPEEYDRLKKSYDEQKAQMKTATGYTIWTEAA